MQDTIPAGTNLGPAIADTVYQLLDAVLGLVDTSTGFASSAMFVDMRDKAEDITPLAAKLYELLEIQTQGGGGPAADGFEPAYAGEVSRYLRKTTAATLAGHSSIARLIGAAQTGHVA
ncbi:hypothetical protein ACIBJI_40205 [Nocardia sp. NPDC050408]|uniref:hypothetical protein n=1 Tax=Nocardia sp. NPDC050408 TaxID=3364319 RepID=UPI0037A3C343